MKTFIALTIAVSTSAFAGEMHTEKDSFTGKTTTVYLSTPEELSKSKAYVSIRKGSNGTASVAVASGYGRVTDCRRNPVLLKDSSGKIHEMTAREFDNKFCVFEIDVQYIKNGFDIRLPMFRGADLDFSFSTKGMIFNQLTD